MKIYLVHKSNKYFQSVKRGKAKMTEKFERAAGFVTKTAALTELAKIKDKDDWNMVEYDV